MKMFDIDSLRRDEKQDGLFDLFEPTFQNLSGYQQSNYVVGPETMMRMDLICNELYKNVDNVDFLLNLNDIDNPLNIMEKDNIFYTGINVIPDFRLNEVDKKSTRNKLLNANKSSKKDPARTNFIEEDKALSPNLLPEPSSPISFEGNELILGR
jgi:hypothetical protein